MPWAEHDMAPGQYWMVWVANPQSPRVPARLYPLLVSKSLLHSQTPEAVSQTPLSEHSESSLVPVTSLTTVMRLVVRELEYSSLRLSGTMRGRLPKFCRNSTVHEVPVSMHAWAPYMTIFVLPDPITGSASM